MNRPKLIPKEIEELNSYSKEQIENICSGELYGLPLIEIGEFKMTLAKNEIEAKRSVKEYLIDNVLECTMIFDIADITGISVVFFRDLFAIRVEDCRKKLYCNRKASQKIEEEFGMDRFTEIRCDGKESTIEDFLGPEFHLACGYSVYVFDYPEVEIYPLGM